jgi:endo-1,4-beta-xylanase
MRYIRPIICLSLASLLLSACGGSSNSPSPNNPSSSSLSSSASVATSSETPSSEASSSEASSSEAQSSEAPSSAIASSTPAEPTRLTLDMSSGWRGNGPNNSGITYNSDGVVFAPTDDSIGAVTDLLKPIQLEDAVIDMVVNVSSEYKTSAAALQIFAQIKGGDWDGEWNCWSGNEQLIANTDVTISCTISEAGKFNQTEHDVQVGVQAKNSPAGTVTIKSMTITLPQATSSSSAQSSSATSIYSANVEQLKALASFPIGAAVTNTESTNFNILTNAAEKALVEKHFGEMTAGNIMKMSYLQPSQGNFTFTDADAFVDYAKEKNINIHGHALLWHSEYQVPGFMKNWNGSTADFITAVENHVSAVVTHYKAKGNVVSWDVVNEALNDETPSDFRTTGSSGSTFYVKSGNSSVYIEKAFLAARAADPSATLYYNDYNIDQNNAKTTKLIEMITDFQTREIPIDGVGFQMHVFMDYPSIASISAAMKKVVNKGLKVKITELDVAVNNPYNSGWPANKITSFNNTVALAQQQRYCEIVKAYMDTVPAAQRGGISVWGTTDANTWLTTATAAYNGEAIAWPLLFDNNYNDKPALRGFADGLQGAACN